MVIYIILFFVAACIGMAISVYAFGTGGKRKKIFQDIYFSVEETDGVGVLYTKSGEYSAVLRKENPVQKYSANIDSYYEFSHLFTAIAQTLGEGYAIHKQDIRSSRMRMGTNMSSYQNPISATSKGVFIQIVPLTSLSPKNPRRADCYHLTIRNGVTSW